MNKICSVNLVEVCQTFCQTCSAGEDSSRYQARFQLLDVVEVRINRDLNSRYRCHLLTAPALSNTKANRGADDGFRRFIARDHKRRQHRSQGAGVKLAARFTNSGNPAQEALLCRKGLLPLPEHENRP